jgi:hypothetical protein
MELIDVNESSDRDVAIALGIAGWFQGRTVDIAPLENLGISLFPAARTVLAEFYGLHIGTCGPGKECATSDIRIDPLSAVHIVGELAKHEQTVCSRLFPLGEVHRSHGFALVDEAGRIYLLNDDLIPFARSFGDALLKLVKGLLPDQS